MHLLKFNINDKSHQFISKKNRKKKKQVLPTFFYFYRFIEEEDYIHIYM